MSSVTAGSFSTELQSEVLSPSSSAWNRSSELLNKMGDLTVAKTYKRETKNRVFVNRSLHLEKIGFFGMDMDYTLAVYKSPQYESLAFRLVVERLICIGYPEAIRDFEYDPSFSVRGLWFDTRYGNLLKVDPYGNLLVCVHGFSFLESSDIQNFYPNRFVQLDEGRIFVLNTLFNLPETYLLSCLVDYFTNSKEYTNGPTGVNCEDLYMSYKSIFQDCRDAFDWVHLEGDLKKITIENLEMYVQKDGRLPTMLDRIRQHEKKTFLLTNSDYTYTKQIMSYLLDGNNRSWESYFDFIVVDAKKPNFFAEGTILRTIDKETGAQRIGTFIGLMQEGHVYSGGSCDVFSELIGAKGKDVLYIGDHIFGDILKSKKIRGWRTFLVIPELAQELYVWTNKKTLYNRLQNLYALLSDMFKNLDSTSLCMPDIRSVREAIREVTLEMDLSFGMLGSLFRSGSRQTFFASQVMRYADIYAVSFLNLLHYPFSYLFKAPSMLMPHESTVEHDTADSAAEFGELVLGAGLGAKAIEDEGTGDQANGAARSSVTKNRDFHVPHLRAETPRRVTHHHDEDDSDDEGCGNGLLRNKCRTTAEVQS